MSAVSKNRSPISAYIPAHIRFRPDLAGEVLLKYGQVTRLVLSPLLQHPPIFTEEDKSGPNLTYPCSYDEGTFRDRRTPVEDSPKESAAPTVTINVSIVKAPRVLSHVPLY